MCEDWACGRLRWAKQATAPFHPHETGLEVELTRQLQLPLRALPSTGDIPNLTLQRLAQTRVTPESEVISGSFLGNSSTGSLDPNLGHRENHNTCGPTLECMNWDQASSAADTRVWTAHPDVHHSHDSQLILGQQRISPALWWTWSSNRPWRDFSQYQCNKANKCLRTIKSTVVTALEHSSPQQGL